MQLLLARLPQKRLAPSIIRQLHTNPAPKSPHPATPPNPTTGVSPQPLPSFVLTNYARKAVSPITESFRAYGRAQRRRPWLVQVLTAVAVYTAGDLNAQLLFGNEDESYDPVRTARGVFIGAIFAIPGYEWYYRVSNMFTRFPTAVAIALRVGMNQLLFTPPFLVCFFAMQGAMAGLSFAEIKEKVITTVPITFRDSCKLWPAVSAFNFWAVPMEFRPLFGGAVAVAWNAYLSWMNTRADKMIVDEETEASSPVLTLESKIKKSGEQPTNDKDTPKKSVAVSRPGQPQKCDATAAAAA